MLGACRVQKFAQNRVYQVVSRRAVRACSIMAAGGTRGAFILFEGVDRTGKSTQARLLVEALKQNKVPAELWNFPDRQDTCTGSLINEYLAGNKDVNPQAAHLLFCTNRQAKRDKMISTLQSGTTLVVDRYAYSGVAYSAAKGVSGMDMDWCKGPDRGLPAPDLVIYMRAGHAVAAERTGFGEERYEKAEFQDKVRAVFEQLCEQDWLVQDASQPIDVIHQQLLPAALDVVKRCQECEPIRRLWDHQPLLKAGQQQQGTGSKQAAVGQTSPVKRHKVLQEQHQQQQQLPEGAQGS